MISANRIEYRGYSSVDFDLKTCMAFESDNGEVSTYLTREAVASESYRGEFKRIHNFKYTETFNPKFTFIKDGFGDFTTEEIRKVLRWLTGGANASFLTVYNDDSNVVHFEILGGFSEVSLYKLGNGRVVGIVATFESAHPYAFSPIKTITKTITGTTNNTFNIDVDSDEESAIYPRITIQKNGSGDVTITNTYADNAQQSRMVALQLKNNGDEETIIIDGANRVISSSHTNRIFGDDFVNWAWLPLYNEINTIAIIGNCTVTFEWREPCKLGEF